MKTKIIEILKSNQAKAFYWTTVVNAIWLAVFFLTSSDWIYAAPALAILNWITKYINKTYLSGENK